MPKTKRRQGVTKKSEIDDLFSRLYRAYSPAPVAYLPFPFPQIAQARAWREHLEPNEENLSKLLGEIREGGMPWLDLAVLIALAEALLRPMRVFELALEVLLPSLFSSSTEDGFPSAPEEELLRMRFLQHYKMKSREVGNAWVLAARSAPLSIRGRPPLVAPRVVGATVAVRLQRQGQSELTAAKAAARLAGELLGSPVRVEDIQHWRRLYYQVKVRSVDGAEIPLTHYLAYPFQVPGESVQEIKHRITYSIPLTPSDFLNAWTLPPSACVDFARLVSRVDRKRRVQREELAESKLSRKKSPPSFEAIDRSLSPEQSAFASLLRFYCAICGKKDMLADEIWPHLVIDHGVPEELCHVPERESRKEIRRKDTGELLATWQEIRPKQPLRQNPMRTS